MGSVLLCSSPLHGHVAPLLAFARHLVAGGHHVRFLTGQRFADDVAATGAVHIPLPHEADFDDRDLAAQFPASVGLRGAARMRFELSTLFIAPLGAQLSAIDGAMAQCRPDVIIADIGFAGAAALSTRPRAARPPLIAVGVAPLVLSDPDVAPFGMARTPLGGRLGTTRNRALSIATRRLALAACQREAEQLTEEATGRRLGVFFTDWAVRADLLLQLTVDGFEYPRRSLPDTVRFIGPASRSSGTPGPLPTWWDEVDDGRPIVQVTQGMVENRDFSRLIGPTLTALGNEDCWITVSTGGRPLYTLPDDLPDNVRASTFMPYDATLRHTAAFVTNGGYGGVHWAMEHGVPMVIAPAGTGASEVAARVAWTGSGINLRTGSPTPDQIAQAVRRVLTEPGFRDSSEFIGLQIAAAPGLAALDEAIEDLTRGRTPASMH